MNPLEKIERSLEQLVEGVPRALFRHRLQPVELGRHLEKTMMRQQRAGVGGNLVPNEFRVELGADDFEGFEGIRSRVESQMEASLIQTANRRKVDFVGPLSVTIVESDSAPRRQPRITATFVERGGRSHRLDRGTQVVPSAEPRNGIPSFGASLELLDSRDSQTHIVAAGTTTIGRAPDNDVVLSSSDVSRKHARIEASARSVRIHDLRSTNGTRVNGETVSQSDLVHGDIVQFGSTRMRFTMFDRARSR